MEDVVNLVNAAKPGEKMEVKVVRGNAHQDPHRHPRRPALLGRIGRIQRPLAPRQFANALRPA